MKKQIVIHFGPPKTGSSAIQGWLSNNRKQLRKEGYFYPEHTLDKNGISSGNLNCLYVRKNNEYHLNNELVNKLKISFEKSNCHTLILSSEYFFYVLEELKKVFARARFVGYVRNPIDFIESMYNQSVKRHGETREIVLGAKLKTEIITKLTLWHEKVGRHNIMLRAYVPSSFANHDVVADFCTALGIECYVPSPVVTVNASYSFEALEFKRWVNQFNIGTIGEQLDILLQVYPGQIHHFSLIPEKVMNDYKKLALKRITILNRKFKVKNFVELKESMSSECSKPFLKQEVEQQQFEKICHYIATQNSSLYEALCREIISYGKNSKELRASELVEVMNKFRFRLPFWRRVGSKLARLAK